LREFRDDLSAARKRVFDAISVRLNSTLVEIARIAPLAGDPSEQGVDKVRHYGKE